MSSRVNLDELWGGGGEANAGSKHASLSSASASSSASGTAVQTPSSASAHGASAVAAFGFTVPRAPANTASAPTAASAAAAVAGAASATSSLSAVSGAAAAAAASAALMSGRAPATPTAASAGLTQGLTDELMHTINEAGLSRMAVDSGVVQNGELVHASAFSAPHGGAQRTPGNLSAGSHASGVAAAAWAQPGTVVQHHHQQIATAAALAASSIGRGHLMHGRPQATAAVVNARAAVQNHKRAAETAEAERKRQQMERDSKGLRHFSRQVCDRVERRGTTTYTEVADDLVREHVATAAAAGQPVTPDGPGEHKNIRRRVYDALNVLRAMNIIRKVKKEIQWIGLPPDAEDEVRRLTTRRDELNSQIVRKRDVMREFLTQYLCVSNLEERNRALCVDSASGAVSLPAPDTRINVPFIIVNASQCAVIDCLMTEDRKEIWFEFSEPFEIHDDNVILRRMALDKPSLRALQALPESVQACINPDVFAEARNLEEQKRVAVATAVAAAPSSSGAAGSSTPNGKAGASGRAEPSTPSKGETLPVTPLRRGAVAGTASAVQRSPATARVTAPSGEGALRTPPGSRAASMSLKSPGGRDNAPVLSPYTRSSRR